MNFIFDKRSGPFLGNNKAMLDAEIYDEANLKSMQDDKS
jgi:hypothetical protein